MTHAARINRRQFARGVLAGSTCLSAGLAAATAIAADDAKSEKGRPENPPTKPAEDKVQEEKKPEVTPEVLLLTYLVRQYPNEHFDEAAISGIFRDIRGDLARSRELQEFPLLNSDEPAFVFRPVSPSTVPANP